MTQNFKSLILTYKTAPLAVREQVSVNEAAAKELLKCMRDYSAASDVLVISTCNRTEIYYVSEKDLSTEIFKGFRLIKNLAPGFEKYFAVLEGIHAIEHLYEVAIGL